MAKFNENILQKLNINFIHTILCINSSGKETTTRMTKNPRQYKYYYHSVKCTESSTIISVKCTSTGYTTCTIAMQPTKKNIINTTSATTTKNNKLIIKNKD